jgi:heme oxygenase
VTTATIPFSQALREGTWSEHSDSEGAGFMEAIMKGKATREDYIALVVEHYFMYEAIEKVAADLAENPTVAPFLNDGLIRMPALERDLEFLLGADWRAQITPQPATVAYADRIREIGAEGWAAGFIAHHYTRYLGDLSGGQMIARRVSTQHGFDGPGAEFYDFQSLGDLSVFKTNYRAALDALGESLSDEERARAIDEVRAAYHFNTAVFVDLTRAKTAMA